MKKTDWILTASGQRFWPLEAEAADVRIEDIAHALAKMCRFNGHCRKFYSVAQHSVLCSEYVAAFSGSVDLQMAALLHDATEAYLPDVTSPIKRNLMVQGPERLMSFAEAEQDLLMVICRAFDFHGGCCHHALVREADVVMVMTERRDIMAPSPWPWSFTAPRLWNTIVPQGCAEAHAEYLRRFHRLQAERKRAKAALEHIEHRTIGSDPETAEEIKSKSKSKSTIGREP